VAQVTFLVRITEYLIAMSAMSLTQNRTPVSDPRNDRRRHARHTSSTWARRASVATGAVGFAILGSGAAAPAQATAPTDLTPLNEVTQSLDVSQLRAAQATAQAAVGYELQDSRAAADSAAQRTALHHKQAARRKAAAAARAKAAAKARAEAASRTTPTADVTASAAAPAPAASGSAAAVVAFVRAQLGKAYVMGATGPGAFDCSGLVQAAYRSIGVDLPRVSESQSTAGRQVSLDDLEPGDVLYWGSAGSAYHVAIYVGGGDFIGAQNPSSGVVEHPLSYDEPTGAVRIA
jgi:peptidoglycan DL-endopeptidase CwlO